VVGTRQPAVAGRFYEREAAALRASLEACFLHPLGPGHLPEVNPEGPHTLRALISPHAGYMFSGPAAAHGFAALAADGLPEFVILLGPSHYSSARTSAVSLARAWRTPLGEVPVDMELGRHLLGGSDLVEVDERAHAREHSLEVQLPFLQFVFGDRAPSIVPICVRAHPSGPLDQLIGDAQALGQTLASIIGTRRGVVLASTDFSHQVPQAVAEERDRLALEAILALQPGQLLRTVATHQITMCGPVPVAIALASVRGREGPRGRLLRYYTSGDIIGDDAAVVGYASVVI
jgi:hypothetical protein